MIEKEIRLSEMDALDVFLRERKIQNKSYLEWNVIQDYVSQRRSAIGAQGTQSPAPDASKGHWHS